MGELSILSQAALADYAEALEPCAMCVVEGSRKLSTFQDKGLIGPKGQRRIIVLDAKGLADIE